MEKRQMQKQKGLTLKLRAETLGRLDQAHLSGVAGGGRLRVPVGFAEDTTPIYDDATTGD